MAVTLLDIEKHVLNLLNETFDTTAADLRAGAAGGTTIAGLTPAGSSVASTLKTIINKGSAELAQSCIPILDTGTLAWTIGTRTNLISAFTPGTAGNVLWSVRGASYAGAALRFVTRAAVERHDPNWMVTGNAAPTDWYFDGSASIGLYPKPNSNATLTIDGFAIPGPAASDTSTFAWISDDLALHLHAWYAADMIARKNMEDQALAARSDDWREWRYLYDMARLDLWRKVPVSIRSYLYPTPPAVTQPSQDMGAQQQQSQTQ